MHAIPLSWSRMGIMSVGQNILPPLFQIYSGYDDINFMYVSIDDIDF